MDGSCYLLYSTLSSTHFFPSFSFFLPLWIWFLLSHKNIDKDEWAGLCRHHSALIQNLKAVTITCCFVRSCGASLVKDRQKVINPLLSLFLSCLSFCYTNNFLKSHNGNYSQAPSFAAICNKMWRTFQRCHQRFASALLALSLQWNWVRKRTFISCVIEMRKVNAPVGSWLIKKSVIFFRITNACVHG